MNKNAAKFLIIIPFLIFSLANYAQEEEGLKPAIKLTARAYPDSVVLRWGPNTPVAWTYANQYGYLLERYTLLKDGELVQNPVRMTLSNQIIKPYPLELWEKQVDVDDYAAIAAQALYGETFELSKNYTSDIVQVINKARELESRHSFALFAADLSPWVAKASGLKFTDTNVRKGEKYLYRVYSAVPENIEKIDTGFIYIGIDDYEELPKPVQLKGEFSDKVALLSWNKAYFDNIYIAYKLERSDDGGKTFFPTEKLPLVNTEPNTKKPSELMYKMDSLPQNFKKYYYRVRGLNAFGELSPPSDTIRGMGIPELSTFPVITNGEVTDRQTVLLAWKFSEEYVQDIEGFIVERTGQSGIPFQKINKEMILPGSRTFEDLSPLASNYYKVKAIGKYKQETESYPYMVQLPDSIPPSPPQGLQGKVDTTGMVTLTWQPNTESDLLGYRVYRSNFEDEEFVQKTNKAVPLPTFTDTINIKTLTKKIFYKIIAVDFRENPSDFSAVLELKRPDVVPPVQPVFTKVRSENGGIYLEWVNSSSVDVVKHILYRKGTNDASWTLVSLFYPEDSVKNYLDGQAETGKNYDYTLVAVDESRLESKPAKPVNMTRINTGIKPEIEKIYIKSDRENKQVTISWEYPYPGVIRFIIYKAKEGGKLNTYKAVDGTEKSFSDKALTVNTGYIYRVKAEYMDGGQSPFSKELTARY